MWYSRITGVSLPKIFLTIQPGLISVMMCCIRNVVFDVILDKPHCNMGGSVPVSGNQPYAGGKFVLRKIFGYFLIITWKLTDSIDHAAHIDRTVLAAGCAVYGLNTFHGSNKPFC